MPCLDCGLPGVTRRCATCRRTVDRARGTRQQRGYDAAHDAERAAWAPVVECGGVRCWRCDELIEPGEAWDLGHDDTDRAITRGPEHAARCNRSAAGRTAHGLAPRPPR